MASNFVTMELVSFPEALSHPCPACPMTAIGCAGILPNGSFGQYAGALFISPRNWVAVPFVRKMADVSANDLRTAWDWLLTDHAQLKVGGMALLPDPVAVLRYLMEASPILGRDSLCAHSSCKARFALMLW